VPRRSPRSLSVEEGTWSFPHYPQVIQTFYSYVRAGKANRSSMEGSDDEETEGPHEVFGVHLLKLAPGSRSGYIGVRPNKSKARPWQAWVHIKGEKRRCLGSFKSPHAAAVQRAVTLACGTDSLPSPRKQAPRNSGRRHPHDSRALLCLASQLCACLTARRHVSLVSCCQ
jgi:hypothetical protein